MPSISGRLIVRPDSNGPIQTWDENNFDQIDDNVVRPTNPISAGDGEFLSNTGPDADEISTWGVQDFVGPFFNAVVSGDIQLWYFNSADVDGDSTYLLASGYLNVGGNDIKVSDRSGSDDASNWKSFKFAGFDGSGLTPSVGTIMGLWSPLDANGLSDYFDVYAAYLEINYNSDFDYCKCHCPIDDDGNVVAFPYPSGACCNWDTDYIQLYEDRCAASIEIVDIKHESINANKEKHFRIEFGDISYSGDVLILGDPDYNKTDVRGHVVDNWLPEYNSNTSFSVGNNNVGVWDVIGGDTISNSIANGVSTPVNTKYVSNLVYQSNDPEILMFGFQDDDDVAPTTGPNAFGSATNIKLKIVDRCDATHPESCGVKYSLHNKTVLGEEGPLLTDVIDKRGASNFSSTFTEKTHQFTLTNDFISSYNFNNMQIKIEHFEANSDDTTYEFSEVELEVTYQAGAGFDVPSGIVKVYKRSSMDDPFKQIGSDITSYPGDNSYYETQGDITLGHPSTQGMGEFVSLNGSGDVFAIGIPEASGGSGVWRAYAWNESSTDWDQLGQDVSGYYDNEPSHVGYHNYGTDVKMSADGSGVISCGLSGPIPNPTGYVTVHSWDGSEWKRKGSVINFGNDVLGTLPFSALKTSLHVAINSSGSIIAIAAPESSSNQGVVKIYQYESTDWVQRGSTVVGDTSSSYNLGASIDLSYDGDVFGVGVANVDGGTPGHYRVYKWDTDYAQVGSNIVTPTSSLEDQAIDYDASQFYGKQVSISEDGSGLLGGSPGQTGGIGTTVAEGFVSHFNWDGTSWNESTTVTAEWPTSVVADHQGRYQMGSDTLVLSKTNKNLIFDGWGRKIPGLSATKGMIESIDLDAGRVYYTPYKESKESFGLNVGDINVPFPRLKQFRTPVSYNDDWESYDENYRSSDTFNQVGINGSGDRVIFTKYKSKANPPIIATTTTPTPVGEDILQAHPNLFYGETAASAFANTGSGVRNPDGEDWAYWSEPLNHYGTKVGTELWADSNLTHPWYDGFWAIHDATDPADGMWVQTISGVIVDNGAGADLWRNTSYIICYDHNDTTWDILGTPINSGGFLTDVTGSNELELVSLHMISGGDSFAAAWVQNDLQDNTCYDCDWDESDPKTFHVGVYYWSDIVNNWHRKGDYISSTISPFVMDGVYGGEKYIHGTFGDELKLNSDGTRLFIKYNPAASGEQQSVHIYDWNGSSWQIYDTVDVGLIKYKTVAYGEDGVITIPSPSVIPSYSCSSSLSRSEKPNFTKSDWNFDINDDGSLLAVGLPYLHMAGVGELQRPDNGGFITYTDVDTEFVTSSYFRNNLNAYSTAVSGTQLGYSISVNGLGDRIAIIANSQIDGSGVFHVFESGVNNDAGCNYSNFWKPLSQSEPGNYIEVPHSAIRLDASGNSLVTFRSYFDGYIDDYTVDRIDRFDYVKNICGEDQPWGWWRSSVVYEDEDKTSLYDNLGFHAAFSDNGAKVASTFNSSWIDADGSGTYHQYGEVYVIENNLRESGLYFETPPVLTCEEWITEGECLSDRFNGIWHSGLKCDNFNVNYCLDQNLSFADVAYPEVTFVSFRILLTGASATVTGLPNGVTHSDGVVSGRTPQVDQDTPYTVYVVVGGITHTFIFTVLNSPCVSCTTTPPERTTTTTNSPTTTTTTTTPTTADPGLGGACCFIGDVAEMWVCVVTTEEECESYKNTPFVQSDTVTWRGEGTSCDDEDRCGETCCKGWDGVGTWEMNHVLVGEPHRCTFSTTFQAVIIEETLTYVVWEFDGNLDCGDYLYIRLKCIKTDIDVPRDYEILRPTSIIDAGGWSIPSDGVTVIADNVDADLDPKVENPCLDETTYIDESSGENTIEIQFEETECQIREEAINTVTGYTLYGFTPNDNLDKAAISLDGGVTYTDFRDQDIGLYEWDLFTFGVPATRTGAIRVKILSDAHGDTELAALYVKVNYAATTTDSACEKRTCLNDADRWVILDVAFPCVTNLNIIDNGNGTCDTPPRVTITGDYARDDCDCCVPKLL